MRQYAASTSPFETQQKDAPWLVWKAGVPLTSLCEAEHVTAQDDALPMYPDEPPAEPESVPLSMPSIRRPQYQSVLSRMRQAAMHTGTYASWSS